MDWSLIAYWVCFGVGTGYAIVSALLGGLHGMFDHAGEIGGGATEMSHDYGAGHDAGGHEGGSGEAYASMGEGEPVISPLSPATISIFLATFGGVGIILTSLFRVNLYVSLPASAGAGIGVSALMMFIFYHLFTRVQASSEARAMDAIGLTGEVTVPVPEGGVGEVAYILRGARLVSAARSQAGKAVPRHTAVRIVRQIGNTLYVEPLALDEAGPPPVAPESLRLKD